MPLDFETGAGAAAGRKSADKAPGGDASELSVSHDGRYVAVGDGAGRVILLDGRHAHTPTR